MVNKYKKRVLLFIFLIILSMNSNVKAAVEIIDGGNSSGSNSACGTYNGYIACYIGKYQFRATLIDENGKKVAGTKSVDFSYSTDKSTSILRLTDLTHDGKQIKLVNDNYRYKYSDDENDYNKYEDFLYIKINMVKDINLYREISGRDNPEDYYKFYNEFSNNVVNRVPNVYYDESKTKPLDFLSVFLNYSGYIKDGTNIDDNIEKAREIANNNYYLLLEPTYLFFYNTTPNSTEKIYKYGTATEILEWMYNEGNKDIDKYKSGYLVGLSANFVYQAGCNMHTEVGGAIEYKKITQNSECNIGSNLLNLKNGPIYPIREERLKIIGNMIGMYKDEDKKTIINGTDNKGHGAAVLQLKNTINTDEPESTIIQVIMDLCQNDDGIISLKYKGENDNNIDESAFINDYFRVGGTTGNSALYCYDEVEYNFENIMKNLSTEFKTLSNITIPDATVTVNRSCYFKSSMTPNNLATDYSEYEDKKIDLKIFNEEGQDTSIKLTYISNIPNPVIDKRNKLTGEGWIEYQNILTFRYNEDGKYYISPDKSYDLSGYIGFDVSNDINSLFGYSNNFLTIFGNKTAMTKEYTDLMGTKKTFTYKLDYTDGSNNLSNKQCNFKYEVDYDNPVSNNNEGLQFRIISLSNPFPARDGTTRIPGTNWLNNHNYVSDYIYNNRGIQYIAGNKELKEIEGTKITNFNSSDIVDPEMMYMNVEPMYTITLTPTIMADIRRYNKDHSYDDIELVCNDENRECYSTFLRNINYITEGNFGGVCSDETKYSQNNTFNGISQEDIKTIDDAMRTNIYGSSPTYKKEHDLNKNYKMDTEDLEIFQNKEKNTYFYTCANKSYKSGG